MLLTLSLSADEQGVVFILSAVHTDASHSCPTHGEGLGLDNAGQLELNVLPITVLSGLVNIYALLLAL